jgi:diguanylate cyclase (GGDEF)-like protein/PAS domain S-box-containing protein
MLHDTYTVLLVTGGAADAWLIDKALTERDDGEWRVERCRRLSEGVERLKQGGIEAVLLDLYLPDSQGIETFEAMCAVTPQVPIFVIADRENEAVARQATQQGAQDHLLKEHLDGYWLPRVLRGAIRRRAVDDDFFIEKEWAQVTLNSIGDAVVATDVSGQITYLNVAAQHMTGWPSEEAIGRPFNEVLTLVNCFSREAAVNPMTRAIEENKTVELAANCLLIRRDGYEYAIEDSAAPIRDRVGRVQGAVMVFHDVSAAQAVRERMAYLAQHDFLTDLPNRIMLNDRIAAAIAMGRRTGRMRAVMFLDLDGFKHINDSMGHPIGDKVLQSVSQRLIGCVRGSDTVSRQGGDEFVVLLAEIEHAADAARSAEKILAALAAPHRVAGMEFNITVSMGISVYPNDGEDAESLIRCADTAMYQAKVRGRNNYQFFTGDMNVRAVERQFLESNLRRALERHEFVLHYQPQFNLKSGAITGVEALIRWRHPDRGLIPPAQFVPVAEDCGLMVPIGRWVLEEACRQAQSWADAGLPRVSIAVNISALEIQSKAFLDGVGTTLEETRLIPSRLELELTESVLIPNAGLIGSTLAALKAIGVRLALDDFGTGYSSLSYLGRFPVDALKIDQSFVRDILDDQQDKAIISAVVSMGNALNKRVIAEGVETPGQLAFLQRLRCAEGQGYHFSPAVDAEEFSTLLKSTKIRARQEQLS